MMFLQLVNDYLKSLGYVSIAFAWIKVLEVCYRDYDENKNFYEIKFKQLNFILSEFYQEQKVIKICSFR